MSDLGVGRRAAALVAAAVGSGLRARVGLAEGGAEPVDGDMCVDLGGVERRVPQEFLDAAKVGAALQQVGGRAVAQAVGAEVGGAFYVPEPGVHHPANSARIDAPALTPRKRAPPERSPIHKGRPYTHHRSSSRIAGRPKGTERSFLPLPSTRIT